MVVNHCNRIINNKDYSGENLNHQISEFATIENVFSILHELRKVYIGTVLLKTVL